MARSNDVNGNECKRVVPLNTWILISNLKLAYNLLRRSDGTFNRDLAEFLDRKVPSNTIPVNGVFSFDIIDKTSNSLINRIYRRPITSTTTTPFIDVETPLSSSQPIPVIIYFHGGSFTHSSSNSAIYDTWCRRLVQICNAVVISVNYRRSPENRYPSAYDDGWNAVKWVSTRPWLRSGKDSRVRIYLAGDSSGGNIAHHVAVRAAAEEEDSKVEVLGNILLHPMFGGEMRTESERRLDGKYFVTLQDRDWYWRAYLPEGEDRDHPACNIFGHRSKSLDGMTRFPKSLVVVAGLDLVQDWQLGYVKGLRSSGHQVQLLYLEKATIGFYFLPNNEHFQVLKEEIREFVESNLD